MQSDENGYQSPNYYYRLPDSVVQNYPTPLQQMSQQLGKDYHQASPFWRIVFLIAGIFITAHLWNAGIRHFFPQKKGK